MASRLNTDVVHSSCVAWAVASFRLERGQFLCTELPIALANRDDVLSLRMVRDPVATPVWSVQNGSFSDLFFLHQAVAKKDLNCQRLMSIPGIGPIIASAIVAAIGNGVVFGKGRDFSAWLGLVPKQMSTGDRTILTTLLTDDKFRDLLFILRLLTTTAPWIMRARKGRQREPAHAVNRSFVCPNCG